jgi:hypothetical protein
VLLRSLLDGAWLPSWQAGLRVQATVSFFQRLVRLIFTICVWPLHFLLLAAFVILNGCTPPSTKALRVCKCGGDCKSTYSLLTVTLIPPAATSAALSSA